MARSRDFKRSLPLRSSLILTIILLVTTAACSGDPTQSTSEGLPTTSSPKGTTQPTEADPTSPESTLTVEIIRYIHPDEFPVVVGACIQEAGWPVEITPDGGISFLPVPEDQEQAKQAAVNVCRSRYPIEPKYLEPLDTQQLELLYDWYLAESIPCLEHQGYSGFDPPPLDVFLESDDADRWFPYSVVLAGASLPMDDWYRLNEECPQGPPTDVLFD